ncbi:MAG: energy-coupling factor ABC transporter ATP-binding protein [Arachnia sp.]
MIELTRVTVTAPPVDRHEPPATLLSEITLRLDEPRICVIGANGSGKSTLLRVIAGLRPPSGGSVRVEGIDAVAERRRVRGVVGFVFTDPLAQLVTPTAVEDVELSLRQHVRDRRQRRMLALRLLEDKGLGGLAHRSIYDLSGGERQLVALTSVLAVEPRVLVADEPTTLLDLRNTSHLRGMLSQLPQQVIYSTHDLDFALDADRAIVIDNGRVAADGEPAAAIAHYRALMAGA